MSKSFYLKNEYATMGWISCTRDSFNDILNPKIMLNYRSINYN